MQTFDVHISDPCRVYAYNVHISDLCHADMWCTHFWSVSHRCLMYIFLICVTQAFNVHISDLCHAGVWWAAAGRGLVGERGHVALALLLLLFPAVPQLLLPCRLRQAGRPHWRLHQVMGQSWSYCVLHNLFLILQLGNVGQLCSLLYTDITDTVMCFKVLGCYLKW